MQPAAVHLSARETHHSHASFGLYKVCTLGSRLSDYLQPVHFCPDVLQPLIHPTPDSADIMADLHLQTQLDDKQSGEKR